MSADEIMKKADSYASLCELAPRDNVDQGNARSALRSDIEQLVAERKTLAKHCVVVIRILSNGIWGKKVWCTVCQAEIDYLSTVGPNSEKLVHKEDCLVEKVMKES